MQHAMIKMMKVCSSAHNLSPSFTIEVLTYPLTKLPVLRYKDIENTIEGCVDILKDLPDKCNEDYTENNEIINILKREIGEKIKVLVSIKMTYDTQKRLIATLRKN